MKSKFPYVLVYYLVFIMAFSIIKHFVGWNANSFAHLGGPASNFVGATIAVLSEIMVALIIGLVCIIVLSKPEVGKFIVWTTASVIPVMIVFLLAAHFVLDGLNKKIEATYQEQLRTEIVSRLPKSIFEKKSGKKNDFSGYVTADNDSLGIILDDTAGMARVYMYVDSAKLGNLELDSCGPVSLELERRLAAYVIPMQSLSLTEIHQNLNYVTNNRSFIADHNIWLDSCSKPVRRFIIINHVYDQVRHLNCYEIGFEADCKTPPAKLLNLFD